MESVSEYIRQRQEIDIHGSEIHEDELLQVLKNDLANGADIDFFSPQMNVYGWTYHGSVLHFAAWYNFNKVVEYALSKGANIALKRSSEEIKSRYRNALEIAARHCNHHSAPIQKLSYEILKKRSLELFSSFGLTSLHVDCALRMRHWTNESRQHLLTADVNASISSESKFWPGMTPLLIAAKFENEDLVTQLLNLGANPFILDPKGNTPLHYLTNPLFYDERLFALDGRNTFGSFTGLSHFHIACRLCPQALGIVKRYLDQGISPDSPAKNVGCEVESIDAGKVGLHIAAFKNCQELTRLLLEYGANVEQEDLKGRTPFESISYYAHRISTYRGSAVPILCSLIEAGSNQERIRIDGLVYATSHCTIENKLVFLTCIRRLSTLRKDLISKKLMDCYQQILAQFANWNEAEYAERCLEELRDLTNLGLLEILDDTVAMKGDFKEKFGWVNSLDLRPYPIYGSLLSLRIKRKLLQYTKKNRKIWQAIPFVQRLFQNQRHIPYLCAETILWNLNDEELARFLGQ